MHTPYHTVLRFYPDRDDPIVFTMAAGGDGEQRVCAITRYGMEMAADASKRPGGPTMVDLESLTCYRRAHDRERRIWAHPERMVYPKEGRQWALSLHAFHIREDWSLITHQVLLRVSRDDRSFDWQTNGFLHKDGDQFVTPLPVHSGKAQKPARAFDVMRDIKGQVMEHGAQGALAHGFTEILNLEDDTLRGMLRTSPVQPPVLAIPRLNGSGALAF